MSTALHELTIAGAARLLRARELSPVELVRALLDRIARLDPHVNAFITVTAERAAADAARAEREIGAGRWRGPLHGVPYGLKDVINTAGILTSGHSRVGAQHVPTEDATVAARLAQAGGVLIGKAATYQFTHGGPSFDPPWPPARNPWNTAHDAGGSSSGSAAAVAAGLALGALGSDTGGSVRIPAAFCGLAGLKPTYGLVSRAGIIPNSFSFDHCGPLARTVEDCALLLQAIAGFDPRDPASVDAAPVDYAAALRTDLAGLRVGVLRHFWEEDLVVAEASRAAMEEALRVLASLGARIEVARVRPLQSYYDVKNTITKVEVFCVHQQGLQDRPADFGMDFLGTTLGGSLFQAVDYVQAQRERTAMMAEIEALYERHDVLVTTNVGPAPALLRRSPLEWWEARTSAASMCIPFSLAGGPALSVCTGFDAAGLPLAMQIAGRPFDEATVLRAGHAFERAAGWSGRRPRLPEDAAPIPAPPAHAPAVPVAAGPEMEVARWAAGRAGLALDEAQLARLRALVQHADAMSSRLRAPRDPSLEGANGFEFPVGLPRGER